jgi:hypothetical protein
MSPPPRVASSEPRDRGPLEGSRVVHRACITLLYCEAAAAGMDQSTDDAPAVHTQADTGSLIPPGSTR